MTGKDAGPRHAAHRASLASRLRGRALAAAAVPTALLVGAVYTPALAASTTSSGTACTTPDNTILSETPVPKSALTVQPSPGTTTKASAPAPATGVGTGAGAGAGAGTTAQSATLTTASGTATGTGTATQTDIIGDLLGGILHLGGTTSTPTASPTPSAGRTPSAAPLPAAPLPTAGSPVKPSAPATPTGTAAPSPGRSTPATATPSPSASSTNPNCVVDTRRMAAARASSGHVVPEQNWTLHSTRLALHGSVFNGVYDVQTPSGTKRVLKFTTASADIGDLDMSTIEVTGKTFHVKGAAGSTSTLQGPITMYVESLSGHLAAIAGLPIPIDLGQITLTPDSLPKWLYDLISAVPIPLDLTLTDAKAVQAGQFGGTLHIPGMRLYNDDLPYGG